jgi:nucleoside phosphorylase
MLLIHTALHAEARALITHFSLKRQHDEHAFACFASESIWLIESGTGRINTAAAVGWLSAKVDVTNPAWLNVGMAGHALHEIGSLRLAQRVEDHDTGHRWYPAMLLGQRPPADNLLTVNTPVSDYPKDSMVDMEASGFFTAAARFTSLELIHSLKVISDNQEQPATRMKANAVESLFNPHMASLEQYVSQLLTLRHSLDDPTLPELDRLIDNHHFSVYQRHTLHRLLQRYYALFPDKPLTASLPDSINNGKGIIQWLNDEIQAAPIIY